MSQAKEAKYYYSEVFNSIQGEGMYTGIHTLWLRFFLCNLQCDGFGQLDPTNPDTYELPYADFDAKSVNRVEDLPVWDKGCDSSYTWSKKFKHLMGHKTAHEIVKVIMETTKTDSNPSGKFYHPVSKQTAHMCFTGGEPMMGHAQRAFREIYYWFRHYENEPSCITFETNGTQALLPDHREWLTNKGTFNTPIFFSVSPKLFTVSGEKADKAIKPEVIADYHKVGSIVNSRNGRVGGQLKFVLGSKQESWEEMEEVIRKVKEAVSPDPNDNRWEWPIYIMPVGATEEEQTATAGEVAEKAFKLGYNVSARVHVYLFGNQIGT